MQNQANYQAEYVPKMRDLVPIAGMFIHSKRVLNAAWHRAEEMSDGSYKMVLRDHYLLLGLNVAMIAKSVESLLF